MKRKTYQEMSKQIVELVGDKENISLFTHCVTRLRFNVRDKSLVKVDTLANVDGVVGTQWSGEQFQVIIGSDVENVYKTICDGYGFGIKKSIEENLDENLTKKDKLSLKTIGSKILGYLSPVMLGIIPAMIAGSMCKVLAIILGPTVFNVISAESGLYFMLTLMNNAFFYFLPVYIGYSAAKVLKTDVLMGIFIGCMVIVPEFVALATAGSELNVLGISIPVANYGQTFLPVILGVWILSYVYKFFKKHIPNVISAMAVPTLTVLVMMPVMFLICGPLGTYLGDLIGNFLIWLAEGNQITSLFAYILLSIGFPYLILGGMHMALINFGLVTFLTLGYDNFVFLLGNAYSFVIYGVAVGVFLKLKNKKSKYQVGTYALTGLLAGVSEPILYGVVLKYKRAMQALLIACGIIGIYCWFLRPAVYNYSVLSNIFSVWPAFIGGSNMNFLIAIGMCAIGFCSGLICSYFVVDTKGE